MQQPDEPISILLIEDNEPDARLIAETFRDARGRRFEITHAARLSEAAQLMSRQPFDAILLDLALPDSFGMTTFKSVQALSPSTAIVVLTGTDDDALALQAVQCGAQDYLVKGVLDAPLLMRSILYAIERQRLSLQVQHQARELERNEMRQQFLELMAHELRNPMSVIKAILTLIRVQSDRGIDPADLALRVQTAEREVDRLSKLLTEVLDAFRLDKHQLDINPQRINLCDVAASALEPFQAASSPHHRFYFQAPVDAVWVNGDFAHLEQVIRNVVENAVKYSPSGGDITVDLGRAGGDVMISVADEGLGIPEAERFEIFKGFYRAPNVTPHDLGGLGLGLFICKEIVERHGGNIWAESRNGGGSVIKITLPSLIDAPTAPLPTLPGNI